MNAELNRKTAIKEVLPTAFGYIGIGIAFGIVSKALVCRLCKLVL